jgi:ferredoxin-NADP reductase
MNNDGKSSNTRIKANVKIVAKENLAEDTLGLYLEKPENFSYKAGQYVLLHVPQLKEKGARESTHSMSLASAPYQDTLLITMRISQSDFKQTINDMEVDDTLEIDGPLGNLCLAEDNQPVVFLAGGIGVAPFHGIVEEQTHLGWPRPIALFYADKTPNDAVFLEKLQEMINKNFTFVPTMTRVDETDKSWQGERGRITAELIQKYMKDACVPKYYIVGLPEMVKSAKEELSKLNVPQDNIKVELFTGY